MRLPLFLFPTLFAALSACSDFPELEDTVDSDATYPDLVPIESLTAKTPDARIEPETAPDTQARIDRLKSRAARLQRDVIDDETHQRMQDGIE
ncbi:MULTISPECIES: hypothetical protein [unclassified Roseovarius]|uniref:hypothetical protein n=1 Tax=unclassified Roseovarius TaxID=2614913 RepID=UPI00273D06A0|nr:MULTISPECIES: hypothetical protein [unclassified Roseovarius]